jgi:hypothetical protein
MPRFVAVLLFLLGLSLSTSANAIVYDVDLSKTGFSQIQINPGCYCDNFYGTYTQVFQFQTGGEVNFGHLTLSPDVFGTPMTQTTTLTS